MPPPEAAPDPLEQDNATGDASPEPESQPVESEPASPQGADPDDDTGLKKAYTML
ncbi:Uncharacterised protein [Serratia odorifera]|uniref:Uncharacterized protein n=2 Tax=Serratia odorifera TaxID=618 RepID=A0A3S4DTQ4_SEROD|nr:Uncharacterised protein [Serratia odorifera]